MIECVGVKFDNGPKIHYVEVPRKVPEVGLNCIVNTKRGLEVALVRTKLKEHSNPNGHFVREAFEEDLKTHQQLKEKAENLKWFLRARVKQAEIRVKIIHLEFNLDETILVVHYSAKELQDLRPFIRDLLEYTQARIEFHNVGPRGQARMLGTIGVCGQASCSSTWLQNFSTIGVRMARYQQLPLSPEKISGPCGRLMCCLQYEHEMYRELFKSLPRKYSQACHDKSGHCGRIVKVNPFKQVVALQTEHNILEYPAEEVRVVPYNYKHSQDNYKHSQGLASSNEKNSEEFTNESFVDENLIDESFTDENFTDEDFAELEDPKEIDTFDLNS